MPLVSCLFFMSITESRHTDNDNSTVLIMIICDLLQEKGPLSINIHFSIITKKWKYLVFLNFLFFNLSGN